jgi:hypothetical protein
MTRLRCARACLAVMCVFSLSIGATAAFAPHTFYEDFPFLAHWVDRLPPFNEHLVTDIGGLYLGLAVAFGWAAWRPERQLARAAAAAFLLVAALHLAFHATHLDGFRTPDAIAELGALASLLIPPALALWAIREPARVG